MAAKTAAAPGPEQILAAAEAFKQKARTAIPDEPATKPANTFLFPESFEIIFQQIKALLRTWLSLSMLLVKLREKISAPFRFHKPNPMHCSES